MIVFNPRKKTLDLRTIGIVGKALQGQMNCLALLEGTRANEEIERTAKQMLESNQIIFVDTVNILL